MGYFEVLARLFPHVGALGLAVTVIIVIRCTPEVGLNAEAVFEVFGAVYFIRGNDATLFVQDKLHSAARNYHLVSVLHCFHSLACHELVSQRLDRQLELVTCNFVTCRNQDFRFDGNDVEIDEVFGIFLGFQTVYVDREFFGDLRSNV